MSDIHSKMFVFVFFLHKFDFVYREQTISLLLETILSGDRVASSSITNGIKVLLNLLGDREIRPTDANETYGMNLLNTVDDDQRNKIALICIPYVDKLRNLLVEPPEVS